MLRFKLVEQVLHIMLNQDTPRSLCLFSAANICIFTLRDIRENGKCVEKSYANVCTAIVSTL